MARKFVWKTTFALFWSSVCITKFVQLGVSMAVLSSDYYQIHLFLSPLVVTSIYFFQ